MELVRRNFTDNILKPHIEFSVMSLIYRRRKSFACLRQNKINKRGYRDICKIITENNFDGNYGITRISK